MRASHILAIFIYVGVATYILHISFLSLITLDQVRIIENVTDIEILGIPIFITLFPFLIPIPLTGMELAILLTALYTIFAIYDLMREVDGERPLKHIFILGTVVLVTSIIIELIQSSMGIETGMLEAENQYIFFLGAMNAPLSEEIGFRVFIIGLASLIIYLIKTREINVVEAFISLIEPYKIHHDKTVISTLYKLVVIQAILFGFAHLLGGGGWDIGKVTTASIAGLYLGYLFVKYGVTSSILGHSYFNIYLLTLSYMNYVGMNTGNFNMVVYADILFIYLLLFGAVYLLIYLYRFIKPKDSMEENDKWSNIDYRTI